MFKNAKIFNHNINTKKVKVGDETYIAWDVSNLKQFKDMFKDAISFNQNLDNTWKIPNTYYNLTYLMN